MSIHQQPKPQSSTWTDDQWEAISARGRHILVAAAAGSGKTAVLVERIIRRISNEMEPVDVDRLLVATFTKAAAAEMKQRIREALEKELLRQPKSHHLRKQLALMGRASITTLHSFCLEVIQRYFSVIQLDPGFRIANETEAELLRQDLLEEMLEAYYGSSREGGSFWKLVERFGGERSDHALMQLIQRLYDISRSHPWPELWLRRTAGMFGPQPAETPVTMDGLGGAPSEEEGERMRVLQEEAYREVAASVEAAAESFSKNFAEQDDELPAELSASKLWRQSLIMDIRLELEGASDLVRQGMELAQLPGGPAPYMDNLQDDLGYIEYLLEVTGQSWSVMYQAFQNHGFGKLKPCRGDEYDKELQEQVKDLRSRAKETVGKIREELFGRTPEQFEAEISEIAPILHTLVDLVSDFGARYQTAKAAKGLIDFADLEHYCLQILRAPESTPDAMKPSQAALDYRQQFAEVLLDEYQDTNRVQEAIVELISNLEPGNRFMVGDVKQSIYRFRLAEPGLFLEKYKSYAADGTGQGHRIDLARNFRSRREVVDAVNFLFKQIMNETVGEISYDERAELVYGAGYPELKDDCSVEMLIVNREGEDGGVQGGDEYSEERETDSGESDAEEESLGLDPAAEAMELETAQIEARAIAVRIRELMGIAGGKDTFGVFDKKIGAARPVAYRDIVILLRATQQWAPVLIEELRQQGIPAYAELSTGYFSATEVEVVMSLLKVIDNPYQDIPLAAVLRSPVAGLSAEEMAQIRIEGRGLPFYDAVKKYASGMRDREARAAAGGSQEAKSQSAVDPELQERLETFLAQLEQWRNEARQGSLADLIWAIYRQTGYYDFVGGLPGGQQRQANLRAFYDRARQYESTSLRGLFRFLRFIERMKDSGGDLGTARALGEQEDVVRIMSIHKSKGLEFPVVFVAGMAKMFNRRDLNDVFLIHKELGFGPRFMDPKLRVSYPTLPSLAIKRRMKLEMLAEEMRVLYVALTRAREKLYLLGTVKSLDKLLADWGRHLDREDSLLPDYELGKAKCYLDWVGPALIRHPDACLWRERLGIAEGSAAGLLQDASKWKFSVIAPSQLAQLESEKDSTQTEEERMNALRQLQLMESDSRRQERLDEILDWQYPHAWAQSAFAKTTVSEIKRLAEQNRIREELESQPPGLVEGNEAKIRTSLLRRPRFMEENKLTPAERGMVYHAVMQNLPLDGREMNEETIQATLSAMLEKQLLTEAQAQVIDGLAILSFFQSDAGRRLLRAIKVQREVPFSFGLPAAQVVEEAGETGAGETVLIQGVIDCLFEDAQGLVLLDYKTDAVRSSGLDELRERYRVQVELYARAVEQIWKRPVTAKYLYFFDGALLIDM